MEMAVLSFLLVFPLPVSLLSCYHFEHASGIVIQEVSIIDCPGLCFSAFLNIAEQDHYAGGCADGMDCEAIGEARITYGALGKMKGECCDSHLCNSSSVSNLLLVFLCLSIFTSK